MKGARAARAHGILAGLACGATLVACAPDDPARPEKEEAMAIESRTVTVNGAKVHLLESGSAQGDCVLLLHGAAFQARTWQELGTLEVLGGHGYRVIALDLPGFGESDGLRGSAEDFLPACFEALSVRRAVVVSPSMSGRFSLVTLARHPELFAGYVPVAPAARELWEEQAEAPEVPTLILWGSEDRIFPVAEAEELARQMPGARVEILEGARHPCYLDQPERFHELLVDFLASVHAD